MARKDSGYEKPLLKKKVGIPTINYLINLRQVTGRRKWGEIVFPN